MKRPFGITVLAMFLLFNGVMLAVHAAVLYSHPDIGGLTSAYLKYLFPIDRYDAANILLGAMIGAIVSLVTAGGLWFMKGLARWAVLLVTGVLLGRGLLGALSILNNDPSQFKTDFPEAVWFRTFVCGVIFLYLLRSDVRRAFGRYDRFTAEIDTTKQDVMYVSGS